LHNNKDFEAIEEDNDVLEEETEYDEVTEYEDDEGDLIKKPSIGRTIFRVFSTILVILCLIAGVGMGIGAFVLKELSPVEASEELVRFTIPAGSNSTRIAGILEENNLIRNEKLFTYYLRYKSEGRFFQAGLYDMYPGITLDEIINKLNSGDTVQIEMVRFTIPEGYTLIQMADKLSEEGLVDRDVFMTLLEDPELYSTRYVGHIPDDPELMYPMEGYLFPDTYEVKKGSTEQEIIERMLKELDNKLDTLAVGWENQLEVLGLNFHEMLTIASLIEREVVVREEGPIVSGVIQNRLEISMPLQIDATVLYALGEHRDTVYFADLEVDNPYNTYKVGGIPPGPIASPSLQAIRAALYPEDTRYFYYVTKKDGTQGHYFGVTLEDHNRNIQRSNQNQ